MLEAPTALSNRPIKETLANLLRERGYADAFGNVGFNRWFCQLEEAGVGYKAEHLRRMIGGDRTLQSDAVSFMARLLAVDPAYFREYRLWQIEQRMVEDPEVVDALYEIAMGFEEAREELRGGGGRKKAGGA